MKMKAAAFLLIATVLAVGTTQPPAQTPFQFISWSACTKDKQCSDGQGDCDEDDQCADGLFCNYNTGTVVWPRYTHDAKTLSKDAEGVDYCTRQIRVDLKRTCGEDGLDCGFEITGKCNGANSCPDKQMVCKDIKYSKNYGRLGVYDVPSGLGSQTICQFKITEIKHHKSRYPSGSADCATGECEEGQGNCNDHSDCKGSSNDGLERVFCNIRTEGSSNLWYSQKLGVAAGQGLGNVGFCVADADVGTCAHAGSGFSVALDTKSDIDGKGHLERKSCSAASKVKLDDCKKACKGLKKCDVYGWKGRDGLDGEDYCYLMNGCKKRSSSVYQFYRYVEDDFNYCAKEKMWTKAQNDADCASGDIITLTASDRVKCSDQIRKDSKCSGVMIFGNSKCACVKKGTSNSCKLQTAQGSIVYTTKQKVYQPLEVQCINKVEKSVSFSKQYTSGTVHTITCLANHTINAAGVTSKKSKCNNGKWSAKLPADLCKQNCSVNVANSVSPAKVVDSGAKATVHCSDGYHFKSGKEETRTCNNGEFDSAFSQCFENVCTCTNGKGATGNKAGCARNNTEVCASCNEGYHQTGKLCTKNVCTCAHGTHTTGKACPKNNTEVCEKCSQGYHRSGKSCAVNKCGCVHGKGTIGTACEKNKSYKCASCSTGYHLEGVACPVNKCTCQNGNGATGTDCAKGGAKWTPYAKCIDCEGNYTLSKDGTDTCLQNCAAKDVDPTNGNSLDHTHTHHASYTSGTVVTISCDEAISSLKGSGESKCTNGGWSAHPTCPLDPYCADVDQIDHEDWNHDCPTGSDNMSYLFKKACNQHSKVQYKTPGANFKQKCCVKDVANKTCEELAALTRRRMLNEDQSSTLERIAFAQKIIDHVHRI